MVDLSEKVKMENVFEKGEESLEENFMKDSEENNGSKEEINVVKLKKELLWNFFVFYVFGVFIYIVYFVIILGV